MSWNEKKARRVLNQALHDAAHGRGLSDRTLERHAALARHDAAESPNAMRRALRSAGWSEKRIGRALAEVRRPSLARRAFRALGQHPYALTGVIALGAAVAFKSGAPLALVLLAWTVIAEWRDR